MVMSYVELRTIQGDSITLNLTTSRPSVGDVVAALKQPPHSYAPGVALMFAGKVLDPSRKVEEFPDGHIVIAGHPAAGPKKTTTRPGVRPTATSTTAPKAASPQATTSSTTRTRFPTEKQTSPTATRSSNNNSNNLNPGSPGARQPSRSPAPAERGSTSMTIKFLIPSTNETTSITVPDNCTVEEAITRAAMFNRSILGAKLVYQGKLLTNSPKVELQSLGVHDGHVIHVATGTTSPEAIKLMELRQEFDKLKAPFHGNSAAQLSELQKKQFYEDSMKILFRLDNLEGLEGDLRLQRKAMVTEVQQLQDAVQHHSC